MKKSSICWLEDDAFFSFEKNEDKYFQGHFTSYRNLMQQPGKTSGSMNHTFGFYYPL